MPTSAPPPPAAPTLASARLVLRPPTLSDAEDSAALWADARVTRWIGGTPSSASAAWLRLLAYAGHWALLGYGYFAVRERATGRFVGEVGLADFRRQVDPPLRHPEAGVALAPWAHGRGYATEALSCVLAWADRVLRPSRTACLVAPENTASQRVVAKCGYARVRETLFQGAPTLVYERVTPDVAVPPV